MTNEEKWYKIRIIEEGTGATSVQDVECNITADRLKFWVQEQLNISSEIFDLQFNGVSLNANLDMTLQQLGILEGADVTLVRLNDQQSKDFNAVIEARREEWRRKNDEYFKQKALEEAAEKSPQDE